MAKVTALNVAVTANTSQFERQMHRVRQQLKSTREAASMSGAAGFAGPMGGRVAGAVGLLGLHPAMMAVAAATGGLAAAITSISSMNERNRTRGVENFGEILESRMSIEQQAAFKRVAEMAKPGGSAGEVAQTLGAFRSGRFEDQSKLIQAGLSSSRMAEIAGMSDADALKALVDLSRSPNGLEIAKAIGGKGGEMFGALARIADPNNIDTALGAGTTGLLARQQARAELMRQDSLATFDPNRRDDAGLLRSDPSREAFFSGATDPRVTQYLEQIAINTRGPG